MFPATRSLTTLAAALMALGTAAWAPDANDAHTVYDVDTGETYFGWAISELADVDGDGITDWVVGSVLENGYAGAVEIRSGATGALLHRRDGDAGDLLGYAMADVGDLDGDGRHDVAVGAPGGAGSGHVDLLSGATGELLRRVDGSAAGDFFGAAVGDAGDVDGDEVPDVLVGATDTAEGGTVVVVSGADGTTVRTYHAPEAGAAFGAGTDGAGDVDGDGHLDHVIGAPDAGSEDRGAAYVYSGDDGAELVTIASQRDGEGLGFDAVGIGDATSDHKVDLLVSAANGGRVVLYRGTGVRRTHR